MNYQVPIDVTADWAVYRVDTRSPFNSWVNWSNVLKFLAQGNNNTQVSCYTQAHTLHYTHTHTTHTPLYIISTGLVFAVPILDIICPSHVVLYSLGHSEVQC